MRKRGTWNCTIAPGRPSGVGKAGVAAGADVAIEPRFAIAQDRARGIAGRGLDGVVEPLSIAGGDQHLGVDAAKRLGVGVFDFGCDDRCMRLE